MDQAVFTINEAAQLLNCARSSIYRMQAGGKLAVANTPVGPRILATEIERLLGGKPIHIAYDPDPKRQAAATHARAVKRDMAGLAGEFRAFMAEVRDTLVRIEARTAIMSAQMTDADQKHLRGVGARGAHKFRVGGSEWPTF